MRGLVQLAWLLAGLMLWMGGGAAARCAAEPAFVGRMGVPIKHGFGLSVEMETAPGNGFQPVYLQFVPTTRTFTRERNLTIEISPGDQMQSGIDFTYRCQVQLPQNARDFRSVQYIPYYYPWSQMHVRVLEDERPLQGCVTTFGLNGARQSPLQHPTIGVVVSGKMNRVLKQNANNETQRQANYRQTLTRLATRPALPHVMAGGAVVQATALWIYGAAVGADVPTDSDPPAWQVCPDVRSLRTAFAGAIPVDTDVPRLDHATALQQLEQVQPAEVQFRVLDAEQMSEQWLAYSQLDVMLIAAPLLQQLEAQPDAYRALTDWLANGGNLWVYATGQASCKVLDQVPLQPIAASLVLGKPAVAKRLQLGEINDQSGWDYNTYNGATRVSQNYAFSGTMPGGSSLRRQVFETAKKNEHAFAATASPASIASRIRQGQFGLGTVTAIDAADPFPQSYQFWSSVVRATGSKQLDWSERHGLDVPSGSTHYWSLLIGSVGQPPVKSFIGLNTLFVLVVGPLCYLYLRRRQHLFLLFFVAPALALLVTGGLVVYAYFADGVRTRTRVRQVTWVDPHAGYQVTQSRQSYFAVLGSRRGLTYPDDVAVYPVLRGSIRAGYRYRRDSSNGRQGMVTALEDRTQFRGCFLPPRSQVQMLVFKPEARSDSLQWDVGDGRVAVTNGLDVDLRNLTLRDKSGGIWQAEHVAVGQRVPLTRVAVGTKPKLAVAPLVPDVLPNLRSTRDPWGRYIAGSHASQLEQRLDSWLQYLPPQRYYAIADSSGQTLLGTEDAEMTDAVHVVMGQLP
ncbi:hypothetical protein [Roseimaritima ulvae]|nr:hypothetical protein [Roseimaritima ulvae]